jgi:hypothetical protein
MKNYIPECGDVGFLGYDKGFLPGAIGFFTTAKGECATKTSHQFQVLYYNNIVEALGAGVKVRSWNDRERDTSEHKAHYIIFRPPATLIEKEAIHVSGMSLNGRRYGFGEIVLQGIDGFFQRIGLQKNGRPVFSRLGALNPRTMICSRAGNYCLNKAGILPAASLAWSPDDTFDEAIRRGWLVVAMDENGADYWNLPQVKE